MSEIDRKYIYEIRSWTNDVGYSIVRIYESEGPIGDPFEDFPFVFHSNWECVDITDMGFGYILSRQVLADSGRMIEKIELI